jgi:hypothetical protein
VAVAEAAAAAADPHIVGVEIGTALYPQNLCPGDLAYFLLAPTLTYQLNFPRLVRRRWRLLSRWVMLAALTAVLMSFLQVFAVVLCPVLLWPCQTSLHQACWRSPTSPPCACPAALHHHANNTLSSCPRTSLHRSSSCCRACRPASCRCER